MRKHRKLKRNKNQSDHIGKIGSSKNGMDGKPAPNKIKSILLYLNAIASIDNQVR